MNTRWFQHLWIQGNRLFRSNASERVTIIGRRKQLCKALSSAVVEHSCPKTEVKAKKKGKTKRQEVDIKLDLTDEQSQGIINELNTRTLEQLTNTKHIGKNKAEALVDYRDEHGPLTSLLQLKDIKGFGKGFFTWLEESGELPATTKKFSRQHEVLNAVVAEEQKNNIQNIVSIDIGLQNAAWIHMDSECNVHAWQQAYISKPKPYNPALLKPQIQAFVDSLPNTDAYIVEMQSHRVGKHAVALLPFVLHLRIMEAMIHCLLPSPVIPLDPHYTSKHFGLPTGHAQKKKAAVSLVQSLFLERHELAIEEECESFLKEKSGLEGSEAIVKGLVGNPVSIDGKDRQTSANGELVVPNSTCPNFKLQISGELIEYFQSCKKKDDLSDCLLQALAFFNLLSESEN